ncbi:MAG: UDP-N-acetylmuramoyl-tripeptide--D-alanyl-D-alanine ligase [Bdellovibrio sp.]|nr:UDP-N-acetylmuramoyl-tripeptide--D-alanyl-D-alanine ligase [Bdellovibrio sp.]
MKWNLNQIAEWTEGKILSSVETDFSEIGTDTRQDLTAQIFIALKGDHYDAHLYLDQAVVKGAKALIVHELPAHFENLKTKVSIILVNDTLIALQKFARGYRKALPVKVLGITGSNGKTTTKEFTAQILGAYRKTHYSHGSFNNHWGVPITLLKMPMDTEFAVIEMGMNHAGEITELVKIAEPDVVVCTMVGTAHIEFFGTQKNIALAKSEIYLESGPYTTRIFNQDQELTYDMMYPSSRKNPNARMLTFSEKNNEADVYFKIEELNMRGMKISGMIGGEKGEAQIPIFGKHNLTNLMAAATIAYACKLNPEQIWKALPLCKTAWGRNQFIETEIGVEILFDGYNANPDSMKALLENIPLLKAAGNKIGVFGQMKELGDLAPVAHEELGKLAAEAGFKQIYFIGEDHLHFSEGITSTKYTGEVFIKPAFENTLGEKLKASVKAGDIVVIKGSRGAGTERFVEFCQPKNWSTKK